MYIFEKVLSTRAVCKGRFKPVHLWKGIITCNPTKKKSFERAAGRGWGGGGVAVGWGGGGGLNSRDVIIVGN